VRCRILECTYQKRFETVVYRNTKEQFDEDIKMRFLNTCLLVLVVLCVGGVFVQPKTTTFCDKDKHFSISTTQPWVAENVDPKEDPDGILDLKTSKDGKNEVHLHFQRTPGPTRLDEDAKHYAKEARQQAPEQNPTVPVNHTSVGGEDARTFVWRWNDNDEPQKTGVWVVDHSDGAYMIYFSGPAAAYNDQSSDVQSMLDSLRWQDKANSR
jgi:hypothetical protein